jgi:hypothetical protein
LLGDVGVMDGDSLLELMFSNHVTLLDWRFGGQPLHLVELVERFLLQFVRRNVKMQLVFFRRGAWLWRNEPSKLFARFALIDHLQKRAVSSLLEVVQYDDFSSPEWHTAVSDLDPNWILTFDSSLAKVKRDKKKVENFLYFCLIVSERRCCSVFRGSLQSSPHIATLQRCFSAWSRVSRKRRCRVGKKTIKNKKFIIIIIFFLYLQGDIGTWLSAHRTKFWHMVVV